MSHANLMKLLNLAQEDEYNLEWQLGDNTEYSNFNTNKHYYGEV